MRTLGYSLAVCVALGLVLAIALAGSVALVILAIPVGLVVAGAVIKLIVEESRHLPPD